MSGGSASASASARISGISFRSPAGYVVALLLALTGSVIAARYSGAAETDLAACPSTSPMVPLDGTYPGQVRYSSPAAGTVWDARSATFTAYPFSTLYPFTVGSATAPANLCVVGGTVRGQQPRTLTWDQMKTSYDGDGLRIASTHGAVVNGLRVDNLEDGVAPRGTPDLYPKDGDGFALRNLYMTYIRDDCVENDDIGGGLISDSLFDGCNTGVSERPSSSDPQWNHPAPAGETLTLDHVLMRLQALPGPRGSNDPALLGHGQLFKWSEVANDLVVRDSVFYVETTPNSDSYFPFPPGTLTSNVTIVWGGSGAFGWSVPAGTRVTTDRSVWDAARARWLERHGCASFTSCSKLYTPDPLDAASAPAPSPEPTSSPTQPPSPAPSPDPTVSPSPTPAPTPTCKPKGWGRGGAKLSRPCRTTANTSPRR